MSTEPYSTTADLLLGNLSAPPDAERYVRLAADEIDGKIGLKYATPVVVGSSPEERPTTLILHRINNFLATGRIILALDGAGQDDQLHQYGLYLVNEATSALQAIVDGDVVLPGATPATSGSSLNTGPILSNVDETSRVEDFREVFGDPNRSALDAPRWPYSASRISPYTW